MHGDADSGGQLALMDALVFLTVALVVSSMMLEQVGGPTEEGSFFGNDFPYMTNEVLTVVMRASLGEQVTVELWQRFVLPAETSFGEVLLLEAMAVLEGGDEAAFEEVETLLLGVLDSLLGPSLRGHLLVVVCEDVETTVVAIEHRPLESMQVSAASQVLSDNDTRLVVRLLVEPALLLEPLGV